MRASIKHERSRQRIAHKAAAERISTIGRSIEIGFQLDPVLLDRCRIGIGRYLVWGSADERNTAERQVQRPRGPRYLARCVGCLQALQR